MIRRPRREDGGSRCCNWTLPCSRKAEKASGKKGWGRRENPGVTCDSASEPLVLKSDPRLTALHSFRTIQPASMVELTEDECLAISRSPLEIAHLRGPLQAAIENDCTDSQQTHPLPSDDDRDSDSTEVDEESGECIRRHKRLDLTDIRRCKRRHLSSSCGPSNTPCSEEASLTRIERLA